MVVAGPSFGLFAHGQQLSLQEHQKNPTKPLRATGVFNDISLTVAAASGMGNHEYTLSDTDFSNAMHGVWVGNAATLISISFGRIAVIAFLLTIQGTQKSKSHLLYFLCASTLGVDHSATLL